MPERADILDAIEKLDPVEREEFLFELCEQFQFPTSATANVRTWHAQEYPSIVATPGVCGGAARLIRTRIPIWVVERMRQVGVSEVDILRSFPNMRATDLVQAWAYASHHHSEIEQAIRENEET